MESFQLLSRIVAAVDTFAHVVAFVLVGVVVLAIAVYVAIKIGPPSVKRQLSGIAKTLGARTLSSGAPMRG